MANKSAQVRAAAELRTELGYVEESVVAALLGVALATLRNRAAAGTLPRRYKLGKKSVYRRSEIEAWIARRGVDRGARQSSQRVPA